MHKRTSAGILAEPESTWLWGPYQGLALVSPKTSGGLVAACCLWIPGKAHALQMPEPQVALQKWRRLSALLLSAFFFFFNHIFKALLNQSNKKVKEKKKRKKRKSSVTAYLLVRALCQIKCSHL